MRRLSVLANYGSELLKRYGQTGDPEDLARAEVLARLVADSCPADADRAAYQSNLAVVLRLQYQRSGDTAFLDEAIELLAQACDLIAVTDPDRGAVSANHAMVLRLRYERTGSAMASSLNRVSDRQQGEFQVVGDVVGCLCGGHGGHRVASPGTC